jgi:hypothetical protein
MKRLNFRDPIWLIFLGALVFRIIGIRWGLPNELRAFSLHPDEQVNLLYAREIVPGKLDFTPSFYNYGTLYLTLLRFVSDVVGTYAGGFDAQGNLTTAGMAQVHLAGRLLNAFFGAGLASLTFAIGRKWLAKAPAVLAAAMVAVAPALVVHSRFQTVDMLAALLAIASVYCAVRTLDRAENLTKIAVLAGVFAGLSAGTKYVGFVAVFALLPALIYRKRVPLFGLSVVACGVAFVVATPGVLLEQAAFIRDFTFELNHSKEGHGIVFAGTSPAPIYHLGNFSLGMGPLSMLLGIVGLILMAIKPPVHESEADSEEESLLPVRPILAILGGFFVVYFLSVSGSQIKFMRYVLPLIPVLALGLGSLVHYIQQKGHTKYGLALGLLMVGGIDRGGFVASGTLTAQMVLPDIRDTAGEWLRKDATESTTVGFISDPWFWSASIQPEVPITRMVGPKNLMELWASWSKPKLARHFPENPAERFDWDVRLLSEDRPDFVTFSSFEYAPMERLKKVTNRTDVENLFVSRYDEFIKRLADEYEKKWDSDPHHSPVVEDMEYVHPRVTIWKRKAK